jgi:hypothetical protein
MTSPSSPEGCDELPVGGGWIARAAGFADAVGADEAGEVLSPRWALFGALFTEGALFGALFTEGALFGALFTEGALFVGAALTADRVPLGATFACEATVLADPLVPFDFVMDFSESVESRVVDGPTHNIRATLRPSYPGKVKRVPGFLSPEHARRAGVPAGNHGDRCSKAVVS